MRDNLAFISLLLRFRRIVYQVTDKPPFTATFPQQRYCGLPYHVSDAVVAISAEICSQIHNLTRQS